MVQAFRGVSIGQDGRFVDKDRKMLETMQFPSCFNQKVDMSKVNMEALVPWISMTVTGFLEGVEDEILVGLVSNLINEESDPRRIQIQLTGFLGVKTSQFMILLWQMLVQAQNSISGIPPSLEKSKSVRDDKTSKNAHYHDGRRSDSRGERHDRNRHGTYSRTRDTRYRESSMNRSRRHADRSRSRDRYRRQRSRSPERSHRHRRSDAVEQRYSRHEHRLPTPTPE